MKLTGYNKVLSDKRKELGLSLKEASARLKILSLTLYLYEQGYIFISKKHYQAFIDVYGLPEDFFEDNYFYPEPEKDEKKENKFVTLSKKWWFRLATVIFLAGSITMVVFGNQQMYSSNQYVLSFYSNDAVMFRANILEKGSRSSEEGFDSIFTYSETAIHIEKNIETTVAGWVYEDPEQIKFTSASIVISPIDTGEQSDGYLEIAMSNTYTGAELAIHQSGIYRAIFYIKDGKYSIKNITDSSYISYDDQSYEYYLYAGLALANVKEYVPYLDEFVQKMTFNTKSTVKSLFVDISNGNDKYTSSFGGGVAMLFFGGVFVALAGLSVLLISLVLVFTHFANKKVLDIDLVDSELDLIKEKRQKIKPNLKFPFIVPETLLRTIVICLILLASIATYSCFSYILGLVGIGGTSKIDTKQLTALINLYKASANLVCIATLLHMFVKIDVFIETKGYIKNAALMFLAGVIFYVGEILIVYSASSGLNNLASLSSFLADYLPGNIFWGMGVYALFAMFLFTKPKFVEGHKKLTIGWHCCSIIPLLYLIISMLYSCMVKTKVWDRASYYFAFLLYPKGLVLTLFVVFFCIGVFIFRNIVIKKYSKSEAEAFFKGNRYVLYKNITAAVLVLILGIIDISIAFTSAKDNVYCAALNLGKNYYILVTIPLILLYRPHLGKRSPKLDGGYVFLYGFSTSLAYVLLAILILPYISYLEPLFAMLLK